jgi:indolepyruvate ferredoxin oxidoreductase beta subunit
VRFPLIERGQADILIALERIEALRYIEFLRPGGKVLVNDHTIVPVTVTTGNALYPARDEIVHALQQVTFDITLVPGVSIATELGNSRANNVVILGVLSSWLEVDVSIWQQVIAERVPPRYRELNLEALKRGRGYT